MSSMDGRRYEVRMAGEVIGVVWKTEPRCWAWKREKGLLIGGYRSTKRAACDALVLSWRNDQSTTPGTQP